MQISLHDLHGVIHDYSVDDEFLYIGALAHADYIKGIAEALIESISDGKHEEVWFLLNWLQSALNPNTRIRTLQFGAQFLQGWTAFVTPEHPLYGLSPEDIAKDVSDQLWERNGAYRKAHEAYIDQVRNLLKRIVPDEIWAQMPDGAQFSEADVQDFLGLMGRETSDDSERALREFLNGIVNRIKDEYPNAEVIAMPLTGDEAKDVQKFLDQIIDGTEHVGDSDDNNNQ